MLYSSPGNHRQMTIGYAGTADALATERCRAGSCLTCAVPFPDELRPVSVVDYRPQWEGDYATLADQIWSLCLAEAGEVEHVGSTSVPGLAAEDVIDVPVRGHLLDADADADVVTEGSSDLGFQQTRYGPISELVFANVHVPTKP